MPDKHLDPKNLHLRLMSVEAEQQKHSAWCRECKQETRALVASIAIENTEFKKQVAEHHARVTRLLATMSKGKDCK